MNIELSSGRLRVQLEEDDRVMLSGTQARDKHADLTLRDQRLDNTIIFHTTKAVLLTVAREILRELLHADAPIGVEVWDALAESVKLQSHYAKLLNMHDGGQRLEFGDVDAWLARLKECQEAKANG